MTHNETMFLCAYVIIFSAEKFYLPYLQIAKLPQPRDSHCAAAFVISSELTEIMLFGGDDQRNCHLSDTTILRMGEFTDLYKIIYFVAEA